MKTGWQVWTYGGMCGFKPIAVRVLFGGEIFNTRQDAESAWYDTMPGRNDRATYVKVSAKGV